MEPPRGACRGMPGPLVGDPGPDRMVVYPPEITPVFLVSIRAVETDFPYRSERASVARSPSRPSMVTHS